MRTKKKSLALLKDILCFNRPTGMMEKFIDVTLLHGREAAMHLHSVSAYIGRLMINNGLENMFNTPLYRKPHVMVFLVQNGDTVPNRMFTCHVDTVDHADNNVFNSEAVVEEPCGDTSYFRLSPAGVAQRRRCLGADDGAGMAILFEMMLDGIDGFYAFFADEEIGMVGSKQLIKDSPRFLECIEHIVSFDRMANDVVTVQMGQAMCNVETAAALEAHFLPKGYKNDNDGMFTDSAAFWPSRADYSTQQYRNCVNIGVGYRSAHGSAEQIDTCLYLHTLQRALTCDWNSVLQRGTELVKASSFLDHWNWDEDGDTEDAAWGQSALGVYANLTATPSSAASVFELRSDISDVIDAVWNRYDELDDDSKRAQLCRLVDYVVDTIAANDGILTMNKWGKNGTVVEDMPEPPCGDDEAR